MKRVTDKVAVDRDGDVLVILIDNPPINAGSLSVRRGILEAIGLLAEDPALRAAVIVGEGTTFIAGSDLREFGKPLEEPQLPAVIRAIELVEKPVVAAIHGAALGGGFELSLGCDARVAAPGALVGLPEVTLGMIPGAGGTQRLPRLVGVARSIRMICAGERIGADHALKLGIVDSIAQGDLRTAAVQFAAGMAGKRRVRDLAVPNEPAAEIELAMQAALRAGRGRPNVRSAIECVQAAAATPIDAALSRERELFQQYRMSEDAAALRHLFFAEREAGKVPSGGAAQPLKRVAVIGGGTRGAGIVICLAEAGLDVAVMELDAAAVEACRARLKDHWASRVRSGRCSAEQASAFEARTSVGTDWQSLADVDLVIEAVSEDLRAKEAVFRRLDAILKPGAIIASNTSHIDLDAIASFTSRPQDVIGLHFFSPAPVTKLLEVVKGEASGANALATGLALARRLKKQPVVVGNALGFIGNRVFDACRRQCEFMLEDGASPQQIDAALETFGFDKGPFGAGIAERGISGRALAPEEIVRRVLGAMANEAARLVSEGVATNASDVDVALVHGCGFPRWVGGPVHWARTHPEDASKAIDEVAASTGAGFVRGDLAVLQA